MKALGGCERLARMFRAHPGRWFSMSELAEIAGTGGWRTRCGELERGEWSEHVGLSLEKRQYRAYSALHGRVINHSERRYVPPSEPKQQALLDARSLELLGRDRRSV